MTKRQDQSSDPIAAALIAAGVPASMRKKVEAQIQAQQAAQQQAPAASSPAPAQASPQSAASSGTPSAGDAAAADNLGVGPPPVAGAASSGPMFIGVPNNFAYKAAPIGPLSTYDQQASQPAITPQYRIGDEFALNGMSVENIARWQQAMVAAGLIGAHSTIRRGVADPTTTAAYKTVLGFANQSGTDAGTALATLLSSPAQTVAPVQPIAANPLDSDAAMRAAAQRALGRDATPDMLKGFEAAYNDQFENAQMAAPPPQTNADQANPDGSPNATDTGLGVTPVGSTKRQMQAPTASAAADQYLQDRYGQEIAQHSAVGAYSELLSVMGGKG